MKHLRSAAVALALVAAPLAAQPAVRLNFDWRPGMRAEVDYAQERVTSDGGRVDTMRIASTYRMDVSAHAEGLAITYSGTRWTAIPPAHDVMGLFYQALARTPSGGRGRMLVTPDGRFLRVEGTEAIVAELEAAIAPLLEQVEGTARQDVSWLMGTLMSPEVLNATAVDEWNALVGAWAGGELKTGELRRLDRTLQTPALAGASIPARLQLRLAGRIRCRRDEAEERCVRLELSLVPDQEALARVIGEVWERAGMTAEERERMSAVRAQLDVQSFILLYTEPETLRPHYLAYRRVMRVDPDQDPLVETRTFRFRYLP